jgi:ATP-binding cassette subfamily B multidrug efflux pump
MKALLTLKGYFLEAKWSLAFGFLSLLIVDGLQLIVPRIIKWAVDDLTEGRITPHGLVRYAVYIVVISISMNFIRFFWRYFILGTSRRIEEKLRNRLFSHIQTLSFRFFDNTKTGDLMAHATNDVSAVRMACGMGIVAAGDSVILGGAALAFMFAINVRLTLMALSIAPFLVVTVLYFGKMVHRRFEKVQATFSLIMERARENFSGMRVVKSYVQEESEIDKFSEVSKQYVHDNMNLVKVWGMFFPTIMFFANLSSAIVLLFGGGKVILSQISMGDFVAFTSYLGILIWPMMAIGWVINMLQRGAASMGRINKILDTEPEIRDSGKVLDLDAARGDLEFDQVSFSYNGGEPVLSGISLRIPRGQTLGVVGRTGTGKSTLVNLIGRLYEIEQGRITVGGHDVKDYPLKTLRRSVGCVPQDTFLFSDTLRENIAFGKIDAGAQEMEEVISVAELKKDLEDFPKGLETLVGERGVTLSGGQRQRVAIARAMLLDPEILILDDAFSSVDTDTEDAILRSLKKRRAGRTNIIISHRISTVKHSDNIILLEDGRISEQGTHEELLELNGTYTQMHYMQQLEEEMERQAAEAD